MPSHLDRLARAEWKRVIDELGSLGIITQLDMAVLAGYCSCYSRVVRLEAIVHKRGEVLVSDNTGQPYSSPYTAALNRALELMHKFAAELGLTPTSRPRLSTGSKQPESDFDRLINSH
jgi:P27 family predicted phage terminase small subunit